MKRCALLLLVAGCAHSRIVANPTYDYRSGRTVKVYGHTPTEARATLDGVELPKVDPSTWSLPEATSLDAGALVISNGTEELVWHAASLLDSDRFVLRTASGVVSSRNVERLQVSPGDILLIESRHPTDHILWASAAPVSGYASWVQLDRVLVVRPNGCSGDFTIRVSGDVDPTTRCDGPYATTCVPMWRVGLHGNDGSRAGSAFDLRCVPRD